MSCFQVSKLGDKVEAALDQIVAEAATGSAAPPGRRPVPPSVAGAPAQHPGSSSQGGPPGRVAVRKVEMRDDITG